MFAPLRNIWRTVSGRLHAQLLAQESYAHPGQSCRSHMSTLSVARNSEQRFLPTSGTTTPLKNILSSSSVDYQSVRTKVRVYYKGSAWKRYNKHNIERRLTTPGGLEVLWRKVLKGKHQLAVYERILPNTVNGKILQSHQLKYNEHPLTKKRLPKPGLF